MDEMMKIGQVLLNRDATLRAAEKICAAFSESERITQNMPLVHHAECINNLLDEISAVGLTCGVNLPDDPLRYLVKLLKNAKEHAKQILEFTPPVMLDQMVKLLVLECATANEVPITDRDEPNMISDMPTPAHLTDRFIFHLLQQLVVAKSGHTDPNTNISKKKKKGRKRNAQKVEIRSRLKVIQVDGINCVRRSDINAVIWDAILQPEFSYHQAMNVGGAVLFDIECQLADAGLSILDEGADTIIMSTSPVDDEGRPQLITHVEQKRYPDWPTEIDTTEH